MAFSAASAFVVSSCGVADGGDRDVITTEGPACSVTRTFTDPLHISKVELAEAVDEGEGFVSQVGRLTDLAMGDTASFVSLTNCNENRAVSLSPEIRSVDVEGQAFDGVVFIERLRDTANMSLIRFEAAAASGGLEANTNAEPNSCGCQEFYPETLGATE